MDVLSRTPLKADHRLPYGEGEFAFGDLWLPTGLKPGQRAPVVVFFHGGWWKAEYDLAYAGFLCDALRKAGIAVWSVEYRRVGNGGGWPATFQDCATGFEFVKKLAATYPLDLSRVVVSGHSAGGHLAFWIAGRHHVPEGSPIALPKPGLAVHGAVSLAGAVDLRLVCDLAGVFEFSNGKRMVRDFMGGLPADVPDRFRAGDPGMLLPLGTPQWLVQGSEDNQIAPQLPERWAGNARAQHETVSVTILPNGDHFDVVDPESRHWPTVLAAFKKACGV